MAEAGLSAVVMEVSSQGLKLDRVAGIRFDYGVFTNLEPDHIGENEHKDFAEYMYCKSLLFKQCKVGLFNVDSEQVSGVLEDTPAVWRPLDLARMPICGRSRWNLYMNRERSGFVIMWAELWILMWISTCPGVSVYTIRLRRSRSAVILRSQCLRSKSTGGCGGKRQDRDRTGVLTLYVNDRLRA